MRNFITKKRVLKHLGHVGMAVLSLTLMTSAVSAVEPAQAANQVIAVEGGKAALNRALTVAKTKPALATAATIVCFACIPVAGAAASPGLCIACGILIAKTLG
jgi:hypothetical protein